MEKNEVMEKIIDLSSTSIEAFEYLLETIKGGEQQIPLYLFPEIVEAYLSIVQAYKRIEKGLPENDIRELSDQVAEELASIGLAIEKGDVEQMGQLIEARMLPLFKTFKCALEDSFNPLIHFS